MKTVFTKEQNDQFLKNLTAIRRIRFMGFAFLLNFSLQYIFNGISMGFASLTYSDYVALFIQSALFGIIFGAVFPIVINRTIKKTFYPKETPQKPKGNFEYAMSVMYKKSKSISMYGTLYISKKGLIFRSNATSQQIEPINWMKKGTIAINREVVKHSVFTHFINPDTPLCIELAHEGKKAQFACYDNKEIIDALKECQLLG